MEAHRNIEELNNEGLTIPTKSILPKKPGFELLRPYCD